MTRPKPKATTLADVRKLASAVDGSMSLVRVWRSGEWCVAAQTANLSVDACHTSRTVALRMALAALKEARRG